MEARPHDREREELIHDAGEPGVGRESHRDAERDPGDGDLGAEQERAARERARRDAERHADPDLAALGLDGAADRD